MGTVNERNRYVGLPTWMARAKHVGRFGQAHGTKVPKHTHTRINIHTDFNNTKVMGSSGLGQKRRI